MIKKITLTLVISDLDEKLLIALQKALKPDTYNVIKNCQVNVIVKDVPKSLHLLIACSEINDLRALFNSYYSIVSSILHLWEEKI